MAKTNSKTPGRPTNFTAEQVSDVVAAMLAEGHPAHQINGNTVRPLLIARFDVTPGIREDAVEKVVKQILTVRTEVEHRTLLKARPSSVEPAVDGVLVRVKKELMLLVAQQHATCMTAADEECEELRAQSDASGQRFRQHPVTRYDHPVTARRCR